MYTIDRETLIVVSVLCHHCIHSNFRQMASATWEWVSCLQLKKKKKEGCLTISRLNDLLRSMLSTMLRT